MQHTHEDHTPPPPYTLVDQFGNRNTNAHENDTNPYPATVISGDGDYRLAQKLQDEEYALWVDQNQQEQQHLRAGESSTTAPPPQRAPISPPIPEHYPRNSYQNTYSTQQHPILYASPNQPPLPYTHIAPYATNVGGSGSRPYYGSLSQGAYYSPPQSHPFYNAPYYNYQQAQQDQHLNYRDEEDSSQGCLTGLYERFIYVFVVVLMICVVSMYTGWGL